MSLKHSKNLLDKINSLFQNISQDQQISSIERDLMLSYVRQFYDAILETGATPVNSKTETAREEVPVLKKPEPIAIQQQPERKPEIVQTTAPTPVMEQIFEPEDRDIFIPKEALHVQTTEPAPLMPEPIKPQVAEVDNDAVNEDFESIVQNAPRQPIQLEKMGARPLIKPTHERIDSSQLFEEKSSRELSDKLGELPIDDLKKGMSLNERIIFLNELFDGNINEFENAIHSLNVAAGFEGAKKLLMILATRFDWATKEKQAKTFIKLVKRRHSR